MNFKRFHESKNLFDGAYTKGFIGTTYIYKNTNTSANCAIIPCEPSTTYSVKKHDDSNRFAIGTSNVIPYDEIQLTGVYYVDTATEYTFTTDSSAHYMVVYVSTGTEQAEPRLMVNTGSQPLPYEPYSSEVWHDIPYYQHKTATDTLTLPAVIYPNDTSITVGLKGNEEHTGTPSPQNPVVISGTGDLETTGEHAGQYKIPISSANTTTNVYLGEVQTTRKVKKLVLTGDESWNTYQSTYFITVRDYYRMYDIGSHLSVCSHYPNIQVMTIPEMHYGLGGLVDGSTHTAWNGNIVFNPAPMISSLIDWKAYLAAQYAAGTPVCVWYVLATETTGIVNEPLMKIGDYADEVSGITIPTIAGANTLSIGTSLRPSEVSVNYKGWHPVQSVHEAENGQWD